MKLTIVVADNAVNKDEVGYGGLDLSSCNIPTNVWALQWDNDSGHIEYTGATSNDEITELPAWATAAEALWETANDAELAAEALRNGEATPETFWADYPVANDPSVTRILLKTYEGITNVRGVDPATNIVKSVETTRVADGATALTSLATLLDDCKALGVPVTSDAIDANQNFKDYMAGLGYSFFNGTNADGQSYEKLYYPWSTELANAKADQDINIGRETTLAAGVDWNGSNWQIDLNSRNNIMNQLTAITSGIYTDTNVTWRNTANADVSLTVEEFKQLAGAVTAKVEEIYLASFTAKG